MTRTVDLKRSGSAAVRSNPYLIGVIASGLVLALLLVFHLDLFNRPVEVAPGAKAPVGTGETWMAVYQGQRRIGYTHRRITDKKEGFGLSDTTVLRVNTMGIVQEVRVVTLASLAADFSLTEVDFDLRSSLFGFRIQGQVQGTHLALTMNGRRQTIALDTPIHLSSGVMDAVARANLEPGKSVRLQVFDPATLGQRPVLVTLIGTEALTVMGQVRPTRKYAVDFMGQPQTAWLDEDGSVVKEQGMMGFTLERVTQAEALSALDASEDLTRLAAVDVNRPIEKPATLERLDLVVSGLDRPLAVDGGRQVFVDNRLTIRRESLPDAGSVVDPGAAAFLAPTAMIEADHPEIAAVAGQVAAADDPPLERVRRILAWVHDSVEKRPVLSIPSALATLRNRMGDCNEHAVLFAALARAAGIPTQVEAGLVYMDGRFYYHAWNVVNLGTWITVDALMNQFPADVTHIRLVRGEASEQLDLMGVIGRLKLKVMDE